MTFLLLVFMGVVNIILMFAAMLMTIRFFQRFGTLQPIHLLVSFLLIVWIFANVSGNILMIQ